MCTVAEGQSVQVLRGGLLRFPDGAVFPHEDCYFEPGSSMVLYYDAAEKPQEVAMSKLTLSEAAPIPDIVPVSLPLIEPVVTLPEPELVTLEAVPAPPSDSVAAVEAADQVGGEYAAILAFMMAVLAVMGGTKAWQYYAQRASEKHELAIREMELKAQVPGVSPPPCQAAQAQAEARMDKLSQQLLRVEVGLVELRNQEDELMDRIKKLEKRIKKIRNQATTRSA